MLHLFIYTYITRRGLSLFDFLRLPDGYLCHFISSISRYSSWEIIGTSFWTEMLASWLAFSLCKRVIENRLTLNNMHSGFQEPETWMIKYVCIKWSASYVRLDLLDQEESLKLSWPLCGEWSWPSFSVANVLVHGKEQDLVMKDCSNGWKYRNVLEMASRQRKGSILGKVKLKT